MQATASECVLDRAGPEAELCQLAARDQRPLSRSELRDPAIRPPHRDGNIPLDAPRIQRGTFPLPHNGNIPRALSKVALGTIPSRLRPHPPRFSSARPKNRGLSLPHWEVVSIP